MWECACVNNVGTACKCPALVLCLTASTCQQHLLVAVQQLIANEHLVRAKLLTAVSVDVVCRHTNNAFSRHFAALECYTKRTVVSKHWQGCISILGPNSWKIGLPQGFPEVLYALRKQFGGSVFVSKKEAQKCNWQLYSKGATPFLQGCLPYLI